MKKRLWRRILTAGCVASLLMTSPGMAVLADELPGEEAAVSDTFVDESEPVETAEKSVPVGTEEDRAAEESAIPEEDESGETLEDEPVIEETVIEESKSENGYAEEDPSVEESFELESSEGVATVAEESVDTVVSVGATSEETAEDNKIVVGDGVTATFDESTGTVVFYSDGGTLWRDWIEKLGIDRDTIEEIRVSELSGKVYLPANSTELFAGSSSKEKLRTLDLSKFDTSKVTNMSAMFQGCDQLRELDLSGFDTSKVTDMSNMFYGCERLTTLDLSSFNTSNVTTMWHMFYLCGNLVALDLSSFSTSNVTSMAGMFRDCYSLTELDLRNFDTSKVCSMDFMFWDCYSLKKLDVGAFDTSSTLNKN